MFPLLLSLTEVDSMNTTDQCPANEGLISKTLCWITHPQFADSDPVDWLAFVVLFVMAGLLWSKVVRQTLEAV